MLHARQNRTSGPADSPDRGHRDQDGQVSVEYALAAAVFVAAAIAVFGLFPALGMGHWVDNVGRAVLVRIDDTADFEPVARELMDR